LLVYRPYSGDSAQLRLSWTDQEYNVALAAMLTDEISLSASRLLRYVQKHSPDFSLVGNLIAFDLQFIDQALPLTLAFAILWRKW